MTTDNIHALCIPTVHLNGTERKELIGQLRRAIITATACKEFLQDAMPHDRDYYPQGEGIGIRARLHMKVRILKVETVIDDLTAIIHAIEKQAADAALDDPNYVGSRHHY